MDYIVTIPSLRKIAGLFMLAMMLVAITFRAVVPAGYMVSHQGDDVFAMVICTANGQETIMVDKNFQPIDTQNQETDNHDTSHPVSADNGICQFAVHTHYTALTDIPQITSGTLLYGVLVLPAQIQSSIYTAFFGNYGTRAPPFINV